MSLTQKKKRNYLCQRTTHWIHCRAIKASVCSYGILGLNSEAIKALCWGSSLGITVGGMYIMLNGIEVSKMRDDKCSPRVIVHVSLVSRPFKNSRACVLIHNMFFVSQDYVIGWWQHCLVLTPGYIRPLQPWQRDMFPKMSATQNGVSTGGRCNDGLCLGCLQTGEHV